MTAAQVKENIEDMVMTLNLSGGQDQYLTFMLGGEEYGVDIHRVEELKGWDRVTHIPNTPDYLLGVINLRGAIVPVADLRQCFGMSAASYGPTTVVIVLRIRSEERERIMGIVVDAVSDVYDIPESERRPAPVTANSNIMESVRSLATVDEKMIIILDIDRLLNADEVSDMNSVAG